MEKMNTSGPQSKRAARKIPYQIRFLAFQTHEDGSRSLYDVVETSFRNAPRFARGFMRNPEVSSFMACAPEATSGREWKR